MVVPSSCRNFCFISLFPILQQILPRFPDPWLNFYPSLASSHSLSYLALARSSPLFLPHYTISKQFIHLIPRHLSLPRLPYNPPSPLYHPISRHPTPISYCSSLSSDLTILYCYPCQSIPPVFNSALITFLHPYCHSIHLTLSHLSIILHPASPHFTGNII